MSEFLRLKKEEIAKKRIQKKQEQTDNASPVNMKNPSVMDLQRMVGNRGTQQLLAQRKAESAGGASLFIQTKMTVGAANDSYEQEADQVANQVVNGNGAENVQREGAMEEEEAQTKRMEIQRQEDGDDAVMQLKSMDIQRLGPAEDEDEGAVGAAPEGADNDAAEGSSAEGAANDVAAAEGANAAAEGQAPDVAQQEDEDAAGINMKRIQRSSMEDSFDVGGNVESSIQAKKGGGQTLDGGTKNFMESRFGHDFSNVNVHTDAESNSLNESLNARAFTTGSDVFFRSGEYNPNSSQGKELLAHELTHVVQQGGAGQLQKKNKDCDNC